MPLEPRHHLRIPDGKRLAIVLSRVLRAMRLHARRQLLAGKVPDFGAYTQVVAQAVLPLLTHEYALGAEYSRRRVRKLGEKKGDKRANRMGGFHVVGGHDAHDVPKRLDHRGRDSGQSQVVSKSLFSSVLSTAFDVFRPEIVTATAMLAAQLAVELVGGVTKAIRERIAKGGKVREILEDVKGVFGEGRAAAVAAYESSRAMHAGQLELAKGAGVKLEWRCSRGACPKCWPLDGKIVSPGEAFAWDGGRAVMMPPYHRGCRCSAIERLK